MPRRRPSGCGCRSRSRRAPCSTTTCAPATWPPAGADVPPMFAGPRVRAGDRAEPVPRRRAQLAIPLPVGCGRAAVVRLGRDEPSTPNRCSPPGGCSGRSSGWTGRPWRSPGGSTAARSRRGPAVAAVVHLTPREGRSSLVADGLTARRRPADFVAERTVHDLERSSPVRRLGPGQRRLRAPARDPVRAGTRRRALTALITRTPRAAGLPPAAVLRQWWLGRKLLVGQVEVHEE